MGANNLAYRMAIFRPKKRGRAQALYPFLMPGPVVGLEPTTGGLQNRVSVVAGISSIFLRRPNAARLSRRAVNSIAFVWLGTT
jgi:hypothetical protein